MQSHLHEFDGSHYVTGGGQTAECKPVDTSASSSSAAYYLNTVDVSGDIKHNESGITTATNTTLGSDCSLGPMNMTAEDSSIISADLYKNSTDHLSGQGALLADCDTVTTNLVSTSSGVVHNRSAVPSSVTSQLSAIRSSNPNDERSSSKRSDRAHPHHSSNNSQLDVEEDALSRSIVRQTEERVGESGIGGHKAYQEEESQMVGGVGSIAARDQYQSHHQEMMMNELLRMQQHRGEAEDAFSRSHSHSQPKPQHSAGSNGRVQPLTESTSSDTAKEVSQLVGPATTTTTTAVAAPQTPQHTARSQLSSPQEQSEDPRSTLGNNLLPTHYLLDSFLVSSLSPCLNAKKRTPLHVALSSNAQCEVAVLANRNLNSIDSSSNDSGRSSAHLIHRARHPKSSQYLSRSVDGLTFFSSNPPLNDKSADPNRFFIAQPSSKALAATKHIVTYFHSREEEGGEEREGNANGNGANAEGDGHSDPHTDAEYAYLRPSNGSAESFISKREPFNFQQQLAPNQIVYSYDGTSPFWSQKPFWFHTVMIDHIQRTVDYQQDLAGGWQRWKVGPLSGMERSVIVNSVDEVCAFLRVSRAGFYAAVSLLDTFLSVCEAPTGNASPNEDLLDANNFRCLIIAAVYISSKLHDIAPPHIRKVIEALGVPVSPETICGMEYRLISTMHFCTHPLALNDVMAYFSHFPLRPSREYLVQRWKDVALKKANANGSSTTFTGGASTVVGTCSSSNVGGQSRNGATAASDSATSLSVSQQQLSAAGAVSPPPPPPFVPDYTAPLPLPIMDSLRCNLRNVLAILSDVVIRSSIMIQAPTLVIGAVLFKTALTVSDYAEIVNFDEDDDGYNVEEDGVDAELIDVDSLLAPPNANESLSLPAIMEHIQKYTGQLSHFRPRSLGSGGYVGFLARAVRGLLGTVGLPVPPTEELAAFYEARCASRQRTAIERANKVVAIQRNVQELSRVLSEEVRYRVRRLDDEEQARREQQQKERDNERERARARAAAREGSSRLRLPQVHVDPTVGTAAVGSGGLVLDDNDDNSNMLGFGFGGHESEGQHNNLANSITTANASTSAATNDDDDFNTNSPAKAHRPQPIHNSTNGTTNNGDIKGTDFETVDFHPYEVARRRAAATSRERRGGEGGVAGGTQRDAEDEDEEQGAEAINNNDQQQQTIEPSGFFGEGLDDATVLFPPEGVHMKGGGTPPIACVETDAAAARDGTTHLVTQKANPSPLPSLLTSVVTSAKNQTSNTGDPTSANVAVTSPSAATTVDIADSNNFSNSDTVNEPVTVNCPDDTDTYGQASRRAERAELAAYTQALHDVAAETTARVDQLLAFEEEGFDVGTVAVQYYLQQCEAEIIAACSSVFLAGRTGGSSSAHHHHQGRNSASNSQSLNQSINNVHGGSLGSSSRQHQLASVTIPPTVPPILVSRYGEQLVKSIIVWFEKYQDRTALQARLEQLHQ